MFRIVRTETLKGFREELDQYDEAVLLLRQQLAKADPDTAATSPAAGCYGCGWPLADVVACDDEPDRELFCWDCVDARVVSEYTVLPGRERDQS